MRLRPRGSPPGDVGVHPPPESLDLGDWQRLGGAPPANLGTLTGLGTTTVKCSANVSRDKTGTPMIEAETPSSLTMTLVGQGLQAVFLGGFLP